MANNRSIANQILSSGKFSGVFSGWGSTRVVAMQCNELGKLKVVADTEDKVINLGEVIKTDKEHGGVKLGVLLSTSIAGCDLMGSTLYTAGICASNCGKVNCIALFCFSSNSIYDRWHHLVY